MPRSPRAEHDDTVAAIRGRIFAYAALERQKEWTYMTERKFDLDGLQFDMAWHLLQLHWNHHHLAYLLTYRPALMHSLATDGPYINKLLLNAIYLSSALSSDRKELLDDINDRQSLGQRFYRRFQQLLLPELERSSIASAVALLTVGSSLVSSGRQTAGWHYSGLGYRMIVDLGLHVSTNQIHTPDPLFLSPKQFEMTEVEQEIRRRVFWGAYINDKFQSLYFGRPPALVTIGIEPSRSFLDTYDELDIWTPYQDTKTTGSPSSHYAPQPAYTISTFNSLIDLADIMADIVDQIYSPKVRLISKEKALHEVERIQCNLELWANSLPSHLLYDPKNDLPPPAHRFNPPMCFHMLHILLHRPFLPQGHLQHFSLDEQEPRRRCRSAAFQIYELAKSYRRAYTLRRATYMFSYALFSAASIVAFKSSDTEPTDSMLQKEVAGFLWAALKELQNGANFGLTKPMMIIRSLFEHAGLNLETITNQPSYHRDLAPSNNPRQHRPFEHNDQTVDLEVHDHAAGSLGGTEFETMFRDLISGAFDGVMNMGDPNLDEDSSVLYGLFR
ncbi:hypothetical protein N7536_006358 [Penicillium majusculum]|uniref:Xylanolytic transcriptional activator regulatory domain-containing protein n=1 Tax=Penicillium solitum TaxID=60172 RepID=A0A1V6RPH8_9EURO|nr:uncharacterized protein PENSOL_c001G01586 [Penicillium solitum]KAJ5695946.1 hypothetical protein N7536_006358 [Penicillium majusculum]OQE03478.1 hypothetical protein PENSOL_c001G01586 [Penicillium solitum]